MFRQNTCVKWNPLYPARIPHSHTHFYSERQKGKKHQKQKQTPPPTTTPPPPTPLQRFSLFQVRKSECYFTARICLLRLKKIISQSMTPQWWNRLFLKENRGTQFGILWQGTHNDGLERARARACVCEYFQPQTAVSKKWNTANRSAFWEMKVGTLVCQFGSLWYFNMWQTLHVNEVFDVFLLHFVEFDMDFKVVCLTFLAWVHSCLNVFVEMCFCQFRILLVWMISPDQCNVWCAG